MKIKDSFVININIIINIKGETKIMAYLFKEGKMASNVLDSALANALIQNNGQDISAKDGSLVVLGELVADKTYEDRGLEYDSYYAKAPEADTDEVVIVDYAGVSSGNITGNNYKLGYKLYDLEVPAGEIVRVRRLHLHDKFWLGASNFVSTPEVGKFAVATAGKMEHTPAAAKAEGKYCIKILVAKDLTVGMSAKGLMYLCEVVAL